MSLHIPAAPSARHTQLETGTHPCQHRCPPVGLQEAGLAVSHHPPWPPHSRGLGGGPRPLTTHRKVCAPLPNPDSRLEEAAQMAAGGCKVVGSSIYFPICPTVLPFTVLPSRLATPTAVGAEAGP